MLQIMISYSRDDSVSVLKLVELLEKHNFHIWIDVRDISPATDWEKVIKANIKKANFVMVIISRKSVESKYVQMEVEYARQSNVKILPIRIETLGNELLPATWSEIQSITWDKSDNISKITEALGNEKTLLKVKSRWREIVLRDLYVFDPSLSYILESLTPYYMQETTLFISIPENVMLSKSRSLEITSIISDSLIKIGYPRFDVQIVGI